MYADLYLVPISLNEFREMVKLLNYWKIDLVAIDVISSKLSLNEAKRVARENGVEILSRVTCNATTRREVLECIHRWARSVDLIAVRPLAAEAARVAARDSRVKIVSMDPSMARYMDRSQATLLRQGGGVIELVMDSFIKGSRLSARRLRSFMIIARRAAAFKVNLIVSSGAKTRWDLWHPRVVAGLLIAMGLPETIALSSMLRRAI